MNSRFNNDVACAFQEAVRRYALDLVPADDGTSLLVGRDFAIALLADFDTVHVAYLEFDNDGTVRMVGIKPYLQDARFTAEDRAQFGDPVGREAYVRASLNVIGSGLTYRCDDILRGDRRWLAQLRARDPRRWAGTTPDTQLTAALLPILARRSGALSAAT